MVLWPMAAMDMPANTWSKLCIGRPARLGWRLCPPCMLLATDAFAEAIICMAAPSTWLMVFARGRMVLEPGLLTAAAWLAPATLFLRARLWPGGTPLVDSRRFRGRAEGVDVWCSFCW